MVDKGKIEMQILLADNQSLTAAGIKYLFRDRKHLTFNEVHEKEELFSHVKTYPDLIILDYTRIKNFTPVHMTKLKKEYPHIPVLVITDDQDKSVILKVLESGVNGFLFKNCGTEEIISAVELILQGEKFYCNRIFDILLESRQLQAAEDCLPTELTSREIEIIKLVAKAKSTNDIASKLNLSPHTISTHRKNIIRKLKINSPVELVRYAYDLGLIKALN